MSIPLAASSSSTTAASANTSSPASSFTGPQRFPYLFRNILDFPRRVACPPSPPVPRVGNVRSFKLTPCYQVTLQDVLKGRHLPPLGRKEFEDFLYFKEHSVENLYFYFWLEQYQAHWAIWAAKQSNATDTDPDAVNVTTGSSLANLPGPHQLSGANPNPQLAMSYARAKETFLTQGSGWELNLPQRTLQQLLHPQVPHPGPKTHPHPSALAGVRFEIENYLNDSLTRFIAQNGGNAGRYRGLFAVSLGIATVLIGLIPIILLSLPPHHHSWHARLARLSSLPALWLGFATLIAGLHGVCVLIFLFGDARQLYAYELRRPPISSPISYRPGLSLNPNLAANAHELKRMSVGRPRLPPFASESLAVDEPERGRRRSAVAVSVNPIKTEYVHLPHRRTGTVTTANSATMVASEAGYDGKYGTNVPDLDDDSTLARTGGNQLDFELYDDEEDLKTGQSESYTSGPPTIQTPVSCSATLFPDTPVVFDFDALPIPPGMRAPDWKLSRTGSNSNSTSLERPHDPAVPAAWHDMEAVSSSMNVTTGSGSISGVRHKLNRVKNWEWNRERTVFSPLTKVLDPVVTRTQWEIVMRSSLIALIISLVIACSSLAIP